MATSRYSTTYRNSYALLIGIDNYLKLSPLKTAVRGVHELEAVLASERHGFEVRKLLNQAASNDAVRAWFGELAKQGHPDDRVLFYFAGHGLTFPGTDRKIPYLALTDTDPQNRGTAIKISDIINEASDTLVAKHILFIFDACFSGLVATRAGGIEKYHDSLMTSRALRAITAGSEGEVVDDDGSPDGRLSVFTHFLLEGLQNPVLNDGLLTATQLGLYLEQQVATYPHARHKPYQLTLPGSGSGDFIFISKPERVAGIAGAQPLAGCKVHDPANLLKDLYEPQRETLKYFSVVSELYILDKITSGQSGSAVFKVGIEPARPSLDLLRGHYFVKIYRTRDGAESERNRLVRQTKLSPYIPALVDSTPIIDEVWMASLYAPATPSSAGVARVLRKLLSPRDHDLAVASVVRLTELLREWNIPERQSYCSPFDLLRRPLRRFIYEEKEPIADRIANVLPGLTAERTKLYFGGHSVLPNPVAYLMRPDLWAAVPPNVSWPIGHIHGDLHSNNVICVTGSPGREVNLALIDFDTYEAENLTLYDLAYLECDLAMRMTNPGSIDDRRMWLKLSAYLASSLDLKGVPWPDISSRYIRDLIDLIVPLRAMVADVCQGNRDFEQAFWIARAAAGLSFARKRKVNPHERVLMLLLSAESLEHLFIHLFEAETDEDLEPYPTRWLASPQSTV